MKLSTKYILFIGLVHAAALVSAWFIFDKDKLFFIGVEALVIISLIIAGRLYVQLIKPLKYLTQGVEAIKDRDFNVKFLPTGQQEVDQLIDVYNQMIDELRTERTRQEQQHFFLEQLINTSPIGIIILDHDDQVAQLNPRAKDLPPALRQHFNDLVPGGSTVVKLDGHTAYKLQKAHFIDRGFPRQFIMIEELTAELLAAEKSAYGKVIRLMAHEVNNTIGPVNSILQSALAADPLWAGHQFNTLKDALQVALDRNQNLNVFMRNFAELVKLPAPKKRQMDLCLLIRNVASLMAIPAERKEVRFEFELPVDTFFIYGDEQLLEQALINIVKNSIEAIDHIGTVGFHLIPQKRILQITDTGHGISDEAAASLFSPFFSTKKDGQGIGLTLVREILLGHGFEFELKTVDDKQTVFTIDLTGR